MALGYIGDRLGLHKAMDGAGPITSGELASKAGLNERYVREWLRAMVAAEYIDYDPKSQKYSCVVRTGVRAVERGQPDVRRRYRTRSFASFLMLQKYYSSTESLVTRVRQILSDHKLVQWQNAESFCLQSAH